MAADTTTNVPDILFTHMYNVQKMVLTIQAFSLLDPANSTRSNIHHLLHITQIIQMNQDDTLNCLLLTSFGPRTIIKGTRDKIIIKATKHLIQITKKCDFLPIKTLVLLRQRRSCTRNGHQPQNTKTQNAN
jgi:hypothetical protein